MNFEEFLKACTDRSFWCEKTVFCFKGVSYEPLFFHFLWNKLVDLGVLPFPKKSVGQDLFKNNIEQMLGQSVLGMANFYWLGDLSDLTKKDKSWSYILKYQGPHHLAFFTTSEIGKSDLSEKLEVIELGAFVSFSEFNNLIQIFGNKIASKKLTVARQIFDMQKELTIDKTCMLINYLELVGGNMVGELPEYLSQIIGSQPVLNQLSNYFFSKQAGKFFPLWVELESRYPEVFWVSFWGEQIWRAFNVVKYMKDRDFVKAKQISYGLPYLFINKQWNDFRLEYLHSLYQGLYEIDYKIKTGSSFPSLDLFYLSHFK